MRKVITFLYLMTELNSTLDLKVEILAKFSECVNLNMNSCFQKTSILPDIFIGFFSKLVLILGLKVLPTLKF